VEGSIVVNKVKNEKGTYGYDAAKDEYGDLVEAGVIDPTKVVRCALANAASVAGLMLTTEVTVTDVPDEKKDPAGGGHMHGGGMGGGMGDMY